MIALIVDDSKLVRSVISDMLRELGIESSQAIDGRDALRMITTNRFDFIILDWNMPIMNGMEFFEEAKEIIETKNIKVIFCSTNNSEAQLSEAIAKGATEYIMKPFDKDILEGKLKILGLI